MTISKTGQLKSLVTIITKLPKRKNIRLKAYDYSSSGVYFITICTKDRKALFWSNVGATSGRPQKYELSKYGKLVDNAEPYTPVVKYRWRCLRETSGLPYNLTYHKPDEGLRFKTSRI